jgi:hypothetical protein
MSTRAQAKDAGAIDRMTGLAGPLVIAAAVISIPIGLATSTFYPGLAQPGTPAFGYSGAVLSITHLMTLAGFALLAFTGAAGRGRLAMVAYTVTLAGLAAQFLGESVLRVDFNVGITLFSVASPAMGGGFILLGIAILRARRWSGWRRYPVLAAGLFVPIVLIPAFALAGGPSFPAITAWAAL